MVEEVEIEPAGERKAAVRDTIIAASVIAFEEERPIQVAACVGEEACPYPDEHQCHFCDRYQCWPNGTVSKLGGTA